MANAKRGIERIVWILSVAASIAAWVILFATADISPQKVVNQAGVAFISWLDRHYFEGEKGLTFEEYLSTIRLPETRQRELDEIKAKIESSIKADSIEQWPFMWELKSPIDPEIWLAQKRKQRTVEEFEVFDARSFLWRDRLREALRVNENEIKQTFPDIDIKRFMQRYGCDKEATSPIKERFGVDNQSKKFDAHQYIKPESYFNITYLKPYGLIISLILFGFFGF